MDNKVVAVVNGVSITQNDLNETINRFPKERQSQFSTSEGKKKLLNEIIFFELVYNYARDNNLEKDKEYLENLKKVKKELLTQAAINKVMREVNVTDQEVKDYYNANKKMYKTPEMVSAKHILTDTLEQSEEVLKKLSDGMPFEEAAKKYSKCPSKSQGGNLGKFSRGQMVPEFEEAAFNLDLGAISKPVKTKFGYHIILVDEKFKPSIKSFHEVKDAIKNGLLQERQSYRYSKLDSDLRNKYKVEIK